MTDEEWFGQISGKTMPDGNPKFPLPDPKLQTSTVGASGEKILKDAFMFWKFCKQNIIIYGNGINDQTKVLDFGCAWSRILRFWLKDIPAANMTGYDVEERFLSIARKDVPGCDYQLIKPFSKLPAADGTFDLIYAFSVFSHLPPKLADDLILEFARVLKPGGIACLTTRPRAHIEVAGSKEVKTAHADIYAKVIQNKREALSRYDEGEFIFYPLHGGGGLTAETYGEAIIPERYARDHWKSLDLIAFRQNYSETYLQPCFVLRKG